MRAPLKWLTRYVELDRDADEVGRLLNGAGIEVTGIDRLGTEWADFRVAEILKVEKHPNADRLSLATVNTGSATMTVVCGAPNIAAGQKVPFAPVGSLVQGQRLEARAIRGIRSEGMLCAADELGLSPDHSGILILDAKHQPGTPLSRILGDEVLELEISPNRPDCLGMIGLAREVAALTRAELRLPALVLEEEGAPIERDFGLRVEEPALCPRFVARLVRGVTIGQSPWWMQSLLHAAGVRAINNVVDVTNFLMLEWSKPLHAYDYDALRGREIIVRRANPGERLTTLDGVERSLTRDMVVIADGQGAIGLGGIMGGADSEVKDSTCDVLIESANFDPVAMRRAARTLGMHSEAVRRFERGVDPEAAPVAADHACFWLARLAGGRTAPGAIDIDHLDHRPRIISFRPSETGRLLGKSYPVEHIVSILDRLGFATALASAHTVDAAVAGDEPLRVVAPSWRLDVSEPADLVEEIARITGYDDLPMTMPRGELPERPAQPAEWTRRMELEDALRPLLRGAGFSEIVSYSLLSARANADIVVDQEELFEPPSLLTAPFIEPVRLANAMSEEQRYLRTSLLPSLLSAHAANRRHEAGGVKLFEIGRGYWPRLNDLPEERKLLGLLASGPWLPQAWQGGGWQADFFDLRGVFELMLASCGVAAEFAPAEHPSLHPGRCAEVRAGTDLLGYLGEIHPLVRERLGLPDEPVLVAELDLEMVSLHASGAGRYVPIRRFPPVQRQLTISLDPAVPAQRVAELIARLGGDVLTDLTLVDLFALADGRRSLSYAFILQSDERTLTDAEANAVRDRIMAALRDELGAVQR